MAAVTNEHGLTDKQQRFCDEYLIDLNATQAAIRAEIQLDEFKKPTGFYVYLLVDPRDGSIFYVGKGKNKRALSHLSLSQAKTINVPKSETIIAIRCAGLKPSVFVFASDLAEDDAFRIESALIKAFAESICNIAGGVTPSKDKVVFAARDGLNRMKDFATWFAERGQYMKQSLVAMYPKVVEEFIELSELTNEDADEVRGRLRVDMARQHAAMQLV